MKERLEEPERTYIYEPRGRVASGVKCWPVGDKLRRGGRHGIIRTLKEEEVQMTGIPVR